MKTTIELLEKLLPVSVSVIPALPATTAPGLMLVRVTASACTM